MRLDESEAGRDALLLQRVGKIGPHYLVTDCGDRLWKRTGGSRRSRSDAV